MNIIDEINKMLEHSGRTVQECLTNLARQSGSKDPIARNAQEGVRKVRLALEPVLVPGNIREGVNILGCHGTYVGEGKKSRHDAPVVKEEPKVITKEVARCEVRNIHGPSMCLIWDNDQPIVDTDVDMRRLGDIGNGLIIGSCVGGAGHSGRLNVHLKSYVPATISLFTGEDELGKHTKSSLYVYCDGTFFRKNQLSVKTIHDSGAVMVMLAKGEYDTVDRAAQFPWVSTNEEALKWLGALCDSRTDRKYVTFSKRNEVSSLVAERYLAKGYKVIDA